MGTLASPPVNYAVAALPYWLGPGPFELPVQRLRHGRPFAPTAELALGPALRAAARQLKSRSSEVALAIAECPMPAGVPDLAVWFADRDALSARLQSGVAAVLGEQELRLVAACGPRRSFKAGHLAQLCGVSEPHLRRLAAALVRRSALVPFGDGWRSAPELRPVGRCYALEAKVTDWRAGMWQAMRYGGYSDGSGLVLDSVTGRTLDRVEQCGRQRGVGVFVDGEWLVRPRLSRLPLLQRLAASEHLIAGLGHRGKGADAGSGSAEPPNQGTDF